MEGYKPEKRIGADLEPNIQFIELPECSDFYPELSELIEAFQKYKDTVDIDLWMNQHPKINSELKKVGNIESLRQYFLFHVILGSTPDIEKITNFDTSDKNFANLIRRIINNNI